MLLAAWLLGCEALTGATAADPHLPALDEDPLGTLAVAATKTPPPAWTTGELPAPEAVGPPEVDAVVGRLCAGADPALNERFEARLEAEAAAGWPGPWTREVLDRCTAPGPALCRWVTDRVAEVPPDQPVPPGLFELWHVAGGCADPALWSWMPRDGGSLYGVVDFLAGQDTRWRPVRDPRIPTLVGGLLTDTGLHRDRALQALGAFDHPDAARLLLDHLGTLPDDERDAVGGWLYRQSDPEAVAVFDGVCARRPDLWGCLEGHEPMGRLDDVVAGANVDLSELLDRHPSYRGAVLDALTRCVDRGVRYDDPRGLSCVRALVGAGEASRAAAAMSAVHDDAVTPSWAARVAQWERFPDPEALVAHLVSLGALPAGFTPVDPRDPPVRVIDLLVAGERALPFEGRSNAALLRDALAANPALADDVVVVRAAVAASGRDELLVWQDGVRFRVPVASGIVDGPRVAATANTVAAKRGLDLRFLACDGALVWGPEAALRGLLDQELLAPLTPEPPEASVVDPLLAPLVGSPSFDEPG